MTSQSPNASANCWAVIPVKAVALGKSRLAGVLAPMQRERLVMAMLRHVILAAQACPAIAKVCVLGPQDGGYDDGVIWLHDSGAGLNGALADSLRGLEALAQEGSPASPSRALILPADLPLVTPADISLMADIPETIIAIAPDRHGSGTNALSLPLAAFGHFRPQFGSGSFAAHRIEALRLGYTVETMLSAGLEKDIDEPSDLPDAHWCRQEAR